MNADIGGWQAPARWVRVTTVDAHTAGEPFRVVTGGFPPVAGATMLERRRYARENLDRWRRALMWEPRGHADMYGCIVTEPVTPGADLGVLFLHNEGYSTMCGHGVIGLVTVALQTGMLAAEQPETEIRIDTPAGLVTARATVGDGRVERVAFRNVASFAPALDQVVEIDGIGPVRYDLAFGGAFYAYVEAAQLGLECRADELPDLIELGRRIKAAVSASRPVDHPLDAELSFLYGTIFVAAPRSADADSRNVCVFADGEVDRSPTGTGVSGRLAIHHARSEIAVGQALTVESIIGTHFAGRVIETTSCGPHAAVIPEIEGNAFITGQHQFLFDPDDPLRDGFLLR